MKTWVNAHQHGRFSMLDGLCHYDKLAERANELGMPALGLTEHGNVHGLLDFYDELTAANVTPILGMEAYAARKTRFDKDEEERAGKALTEFEQRGPHHLTVLARNYEGYQNLIKLSSRAFLEGFYVKPRLDHELIAEHSEGLIVLSGCLAGEVCQALMRHDYEHALHTAAWYQETIGKDHYFIEVMNHDIPEQKEVMPQLIEIAKAINAPIVPTADCHYVHKEDAHAHDIMLAVSTGATINDENRFKFYNDQFYLKSYDEMAEVFPEEWLENTLKISDQVDIKLSFGELYFPEYPKVPGGESVNSFLEKLVWQGIRERYGEPSPEVLARTEHELGVVKRMGFQSYFLVVWDLVKWAKDNAIRVGWGRGSAAGSILSYALGITELDPLRFGLLFERFLVEGRKSMPDIDLDFDSRFRDRVIDYAREVYGSDHVAHICTFSSVGAKQAIRDSARAQGFDYKVGDRLSKVVPPPVLGVSKTLAECWNNKDFRREAESNKETKATIAAARNLEGLYRQTGIHAAGVVISQAPTIDFVPVMRRNLKNGNPGPIVTQWDMHRVEQNGQLKIDFLALRNLDVIDICIVDMVKKIHGELIDDKKLPLDDSLTYESLRAGHTMGIFQLESAGMREMAVAMQPLVIDDIAALVALYRPGPMNSGMDRMYIARKNGKEKVSYAHPKLKDILTDNYGILLYQEDVLNVSRHLAGFDEGEADDLRKVMGKKLMDKVQLFRQKFVEGCDKYSGVDSAVANKIYSDIEYFAGYGFNKAHAYSYAMVAYVTAYLKVHYPAEYMAALLTSVATKPEKQALYLNECRRMHITVRPPSINESSASFEVISDKEILFGLQSIRGVGGTMVKKLVDTEREHFIGIHDFMRRSDPGALNKATFEHMIHSGALDDLVPEQPDRGLSRDERTHILDLEKKELGLYILEHPLWSAWSTVEPSTTHTIDSLAVLNNSSVVTVGGLVSDLKKSTTKNGDPMMRFGLEDLTGSTEVIVFPRETKRLSRSPQNGDIITMVARVQHEGDEEHFVSKLFLTDISFPDLSAATGEESIVLRFDGGLNYSIMKTIEQIIEDTPGRSPVFVKYPEGKHEMTLAFKKPTSLDVKEQLLSLVALDQGSDIYGNEPH